MRRWAWSIVIVCSLITAAASVYVVGHFTINTDTTDMLSPDLPFRRAAKALAYAFPQYENTIVVVVEGRTPDITADAGDLLADRLQQRSDLLLEVFDPLGDDFFRRNGLLYLETDRLQELADRLSQAQPFLGALARDPSLRGLFELLTQVAEFAVRGEGVDGLAVSPVLDAIAEVANAQAAGRPATLSWEQLMSGGVSANPNGNRRLIIVNPRLDFASMRPAEKPITVIRSIVSELFPKDQEDVRVRLTGEAALSDDELQTVELGRGSPEILSLLIVSVLAAICFRAVGLAAATLVTVLVGLIWTAAFAVLTIGGFNLISVAFAVLFIGLGVDFGIHYALRFKEGLDWGLKQAAALRRATAGVAGALALCALCHAIGFFSFLPTDYVGLAELGLIAGAGMGIALIANLTLLPALLALLPEHTARPRGVDEFKEGAITRAIERHPRPILLAATLAGLAAVPFVPHARFDVDPLNLKDPESESVATLNDLMRDRMTDAYAIAFLTPDLATAEALGARMRALEPVAGTMTVSDFVPSDQEAKLSIIDTLALMLEPTLGGPQKAPPDQAETLASVARLEQALVTLSAKEGATAEAGGRLLAALRALPAKDTDPAVLIDLETRLLAGFPGRLKALRTSLTAEPISLDSLPDSLRNRWLTASGETRLEVYPRHPIHKDLQGLGTFVTAVQSIATDATGPPVVIFEAGRTMVRAFVEAGLLAIGGITIVLAILLRSFRHLVLVFSPLVLAALLTVVASVVFSLPFNFANIIVLPLLFALGVAASLNLVIRLRQEGNAVDMLNSCTPRAVVFSALTTISSFGTLALSEHPGIASMGLLLTIAIGLTLVCSLVVLPALMAVFGEAQGASDSRR